MFPTSWNCVTTNNDNALSVCVCALTRACTHRCAAGDQAQGVVHARQALCH